MELTALSIVRNANLIGYPWLECYQAVMPFVDTFVLGEGYSEDDTWEWCLKLRAKYPEKVQLHRYKWPALPGGFAIGEATNECLSHCPEGWSLCVQADELWHPYSLAVIRHFLLKGAYPKEVDGFSFNYLHLEHNCQELQGGGDLEHQLGAGYQRAIRLVKNVDYIKSFRDGWTFDGCRHMEHPRLRFPLVHINYFLYHNVLSKRKQQAEETFSDLGHYVAGAEATAREWAGHKTIPEKFLRKTSPFLEFLHPRLWPLLGTLRYIPSLERRYDAT